MRRLLGDVFRVVGFAAFFFFVVFFLSKIGGDFPGPAETEKVTGKQHYSICTSHSLASRMLPYQRPIPNFYKCSEPHNDLDWYQSGEEV